MPMRTILKWAAGIILVVAVKASIPYLWPYVSHALVELSPGAGTIATRPSPCFDPRHQDDPACEPPAMAQSGEPKVQLQSRIARARHFAELYKHEAARQEIDAALSIDPSSLEARHFSARLALTTGDFTLAEREILAALAQAPRQSDLRATRATITELKSAKWEAVREFESILATDPTHAYSRFAAARLRRSLGHTEAAIAHLDRLLMQDANHQNARMMRGLARLAVNEPAAAIDDLNIALAKDPHRLDLITARIEAFRLLGDNRSALSDYESILGPVGGRPNYALGGDRLAKFLAQRAYMLVRVNRLDEAAEEIVRSVATGGTPAVLRMQVFLRRHGYAHLPLDGRESPSLKAALRECFGLNGCFSDIQKPI
jgi:tetratricopeptide (TPR) repeat protein